MIIDAIRPPLHSPCASQHKRKKFSSAEGPWNRIHTDPDMAEVVMELVERRLEDNTGDLRDLHPDAAGEKTNGPAWTGREQDLSN